MNAIIKVGFCVAYDWELLQKSVPRIYKEADIICLSLDKERLSWSGKRFDFDEARFFSWVKRVDVDGKIKVYEDNFFVKGKTAIQNDNRQRYLMSKFLGDGGWHIQIDADEYFLNFNSFKEYLLKLYASPTGKEKPINICCNWISLIKKLKNGYLYIKNEENKYETAPFATNVPEYLNARHNSHFNHISNYFVLHETWARGEEQLLQKINSWGHDDDFESKESYFNLWKVLDEQNYRYIKNFHPLTGDTWQSLGFVPHLEIDKLVEWMHQHGRLSLTSTYLLLRNNRVIQGIKQRINF